MTQPHAVMLMVEDKRLTIVTETTARALGATVVAPLSEEASAAAQVRSPRVIVATDDIWLCGHLAAGWNVAARIVRDPQGAPTIAELRVLPRETQRTSDLRGVYWSADVLGHRAVLRSPPLTTRMLRNLTLSPFWNRFNEAQPLFAGLPPMPESEPVKWLREMAPGKQGDALKPPPRGRPRRISERDHAHVAQKYSALLKKRVRNPVEVLAAAEGWSVSTARARVYMARQQGFLNRAPMKGRAGGELTEKSRTLLRKNRRR